MSAVLQVKTARPANGNRGESYTAEGCEDSLLRAVRTLRGIRERYETEHKADSPHVRAHSVLVALGYADLVWLTAAIDALEKSIAEGAAERGARAGRKL